MIENIGEIILIMSIPSAFTGFCFWMLQRKIDKRNNEQDKREEARLKNELMLIQKVDASLCLGEATARAVQRIPDAHCNGDMHEALEYAGRIKHSQKEFLAAQGIHAILDTGAA